MIPISEKPQNPQLTTKGREVPSAFAGANFLILFPKRIWRKYKKSGRFLKCSFISVGVSSRFSRPSTLHESEVEVIGKDYWHIFYQNSQARFIFFDINFEIDYK